MAEKFGALATSIYVEEVEVCITGFRAKWNEWSVRFIAFLEAEMHHWVVEVAPE
jgi:hypothetical protein